MKQLISTLLGGFHRGGPARPYDGRPIPGEVVIPRKRDPGNGAVVGLSAPLVIVEGVVCRDIAGVPKDGSMVQLLVRQLEDGEGPEGYTTPWDPLEDARVSWTIGFNTLKDTGEDAWNLVGWSWTHDHFLDGHGVPIGWLPLTHWKMPSDG